MSLPVYLYLCTCPCTLYPVHLYSVYLSLYPVYLSLYPVYLSLYLSLYPVYLSLYSVYLSLYPVYLSLYSVYLSLYSVYLSLSLYPVYLYSVYLYLSLYPVYLYSVYLSLSLYPVYLYSVYLYLSLYLCTCPRALCSVSITPLTTMKGSPDLIPDADLDPSRVCKGKGAVTLRATRVHIDDEGRVSTEPSKSEPLRHAGTTHIAPPRLSRMED
ncbi:hypothetical protein EYF80_055562 [Liparis tanakae]|uniref:Uncharacterized protein n=1 Tax=Liparis tanakae TaxID=230148 RepID=A0A4Z2EZR9_9TELE|nr:hypothetical protein EYF80_055562 [Liparis tanakae]